MYHKLKIKKFGNLEQDIDQKKLIKALQDTYKNTAFSTFPYIIKNYSSKKSIEKLNCGNCIALSMYLRNYLTNNYNVKSYLVPATIPRKYSNYFYLDISHVALAVPKSKNKIYIVDPAFYFLSPAQVNKSTNEKYLYSKNIYEIEKNDNPREYTSLDKVIYRKDKLTECLKLNDYQQIPKDTFFIECKYSDDHSDKWRYYLTQIENPDKSISNFFSNIKNEPFILCTNLDKNGICESGYYVRVKDERITVKYKNEFVESISFEDILKNKEEFKNKIKNYGIKKFFGDDIINSIIDYVKDNEKFKNNINIED